MSVGGVRSSDSSVRCGSEKYKTERKRENTECGGVGKNGENGVEDGPTLAALLFSYAHKHTTDLHKHIYTNTYTPTQNTDTPKNYQAYLEIEKMGNLQR